MDPGSTTNAGPLPYGSPHDACGTPARRLTPGCRRAGRSGPRRCLGPRRAHSAVLERSAVPPAHQLLSPPAGCPPRTRRPVRPDSSQCRARCLSRRRPARRDTSCKRGTQLARSPTTRPSTFPLSSARRSVTASAAHGRARKAAASSSRHGAALAAQRHDAVVGQDARRSRPRSPRDTAWPPRAAPRSRPPAPPAPAAPPPPRRRRASRRCLRAADGRCRAPARPRPARRRPDGGAPAAPPSAGRGRAATRATPGLSGRSAPRGQHLDHRVHVEILPHRRAHRLVLVPRASRHSPPLRVR